MVKNLPAMQETWVQSLGQEDPLELWLLTPVFLPGKSNGQRSLAGYSPWGRKRFGYDLATKTSRIYFAPPKLKASLIAEFVYSVERDMPLFLLTLFLNLNMGLCSMSPIN